MSRFRVLFLLVLIACSAWGSEPAQNISDPTTGPSKASPPLEDGIFWETEDDGSKTAIFVSEEILNTGPWNTLGMKPFTREMLERRTSGPDLPEVDPFGRPYPECAYDSHTGIGDPHWKAVSFSEFISPKRVAIIGRVLQVIPGWNSYGRISSMVELRVEEVYRALHGWPRVGDSIFYEQLRGTITIRGRQLCDAARPGRESLRAEVGQLLFVVGNHLEQLDPRFLYGGVEWPVVGDEIEPQPYTGITERRPVKLTEIRQILLSGRDLASLSDSVGIFACKAAKILLDTSLRSAGSFDTPLIEPKPVLAELPALPREAP